MNLYWPLYKNLESEYIKLSFNIQLDDNQKSTYSTKISELILRCAVEIESISKEIYQKLGGPKVGADIKYDHDALKLINLTYKIEKKVVYIKYHNCFFSSKVLIPFEKSCTKINGKKTYCWNQAYQGLKHDRANSLTLGSIQNLTEILAALFLLNIYYKEEEFLTNDPENIKSDLFSVEFHPTQFNFNKLDKFQIDIILNSDLEKSVYRSEITEESYKTAKIEYTRQVRIAIEVYNENVHNMVNNRAYEQMPYKENEDESISKKRTELMADLKTEIEKELGILKLEKQQLKLREYNTTYVLNKQ